ncbi:hypothetical protein [Hymenobacter aerilatus]|nr:hypothetical protein [Hymenobacter aerilatus]
MRTIYDYLPHAQHLTGLTRIPPSSRLDRKTYNALKIYQGIHKS